MARTSDPTLKTPPRVTIAMRLRRAVAGFCLGWVWCSFGSLLCVSALAVGYNDLDEGLSRFRDEWWAQIALMAYFGSYTGAWAGSTVGPLSMGPSRYRRPAVACSLAGSAVGALLAAAVGAAIGVLVVSQPSLRIDAAFLSSGLGMEHGILGGWLAGRWFTRV